MKITDEFKTELAERTQLEQKIKNGESLNIADLKFLSEKSIDETVLTSIAKKLMECQLKEITGDIKQAIRFLRNNERTNIEIKKALGAFLKKCNSMNDYSPRIFGSVNQDPSSSPAKATKRVSTKTDDDLSFLGGNERRDPSIVNLDALKTLYTPYTEEADSKKCCCATM